MMLGEWLDTWLTLYIDPSSLAKNTKACYHRAVRAVPEGIRQVELASLTALDILPWILEVARTHPRAAQLDHITLVMALRTAAKLRLCPDLILDKDTLPKPVHAPAKALILSHEQLISYARCAASTDTAPVLLFCCCGLRRAEARGMRWDAVDLDDGIITVAGQRHGASQELAPLKTAHAYRRLMLPADVADLLRRWPRSISGWVCDASERHVYDDHHRVLSLLGLPPVTLHGLRHSIATAAVLGGVPVKVLQGALGHANYAITADLYADHLPSVSKVVGQVW